ncbi:MAG: discoidin domain-containing protein [Thermoguttaceae bacterium]
MFRLCVAMIGKVLFTAAAVSAAALELVPEKPNELKFEPAEAKYVRFLIHASAGNQPCCIDELEVYGPDGNENLALADKRAKATASSCLPGHAVHQVAHLNDGLYGNSRSWIPDGVAGEWAQIELPQATKIAKVVFSRDREGRYRDRMPTAFQIQISLDGKQWKTVFEVKSAAPAAVPARSSVKPAAPQVPGPPMLAEIDPTAMSEPIDPHKLLRCVFTLEADSFWQATRIDPIERALGQFNDMIARFVARGLDTSGEEKQLAEFQHRQQALAKGDPQAADWQTLFFDLRLAKRRLMFRDPELAPLGKILFVKRHPYEPSHNYSDIMDSKFRAGGGICVLEIPRRDGRLDTADARATMLFDGSGGIPRDPVADFDARTIYFAYRPTGPRGQAYWHLMSMKGDGSGLRQLTDGPFHDYYPCPLPDGDLAFITSRCRCRFLCWVPQSMVLFRMGLDGQNMRALSHANLSEWGPSIMSDGRIIWTRSEYIDKGANFGHTLWAIRPDGAHPELIYGNNTKNCLMNGREVPGTSEVCATLISHFGDFNGPIALVDTAKGRSNFDAAVSITPDVRYNFDHGWPKARCFRDPVPLSRDCILVSHAPLDRFGLFVIDRYGNRELLYLDPAIGSMAPTPLRPVPRPPVLAPEASPAAEGGTAELVLIDVYRGLEPAVERGTIKYLRVCEELRSNLEQLPDGRYKEEYPPFQDYYAAPTHKLSGPHGWPSFVAKGVHGIVPVEEDGSAHFYAPAGKVLYFQALDKDFNEVQRMRSVMQLQPGERRSCIGCHEDRTTAPPSGHTLAARGEPRRIQPPSWGAGPFSYQQVVQPVWDARCVRCHDAADKQKLNLTGAIDAEKIPASYRTLIAQGWVHYFSYGWNLSHHKAPPLSFGTVKSKLLTIIDGEHYEVRLTADERQRIKCWIDLNCPLWGDYQNRNTRCTDNTCSKAK